MDWITSPSAWIALATLTALEIVLGIDNIIFISILADRLPVAQRKRARTVGLAAAMITRLLLLFSLGAIMRLTKPLFEVFGRAISGRDLILLVGGLFLLYKATHEIHEMMEGDSDRERASTASKFGEVILQIMVLDVVFSLDSVITAVGMAEHIEVMVAAVVISVGIMMWAAAPVANFVQAHPTVKMLALAFLLLVGMTLVADGFGFHVPKGYIYFAMAFSLLVEMLNLRAAKKR
ncbi:MAG: TerC family protein [Bryobacteraceae bacterium]|nr:TerC family protein [Bryobacteraceae bacterium]